DDVGAVATEHLRRRHRRQLTGLGRVAVYDLAGLQAPLPRIRRGSATALHRRLTDPVLEPERRTSGGQLVADLPPDQLDARELLRGATRLVHARLVPRGVGGEDGHRHMYGGPSQRLLPVLG